ncbi:hypothetical protein [Niallia sp.]|uniref:hypothetical protein n=1 Tax=Niallia sp. TaxID=2837523 RepID=UPI00289BE0E2|nr:hypothetical protein [Niallia sp.]
MKLNSEVLNVPSPFLEYIVMRMFMMKYYEKDHYSIAFQYPLNHFESSYVIPEFQMLFDKVRWKNNVVTLTNLRQNIYDQILTQVSCCDMQSSYFAIIHYLNQQTKVEDRMDTFPTILTGDLVSPEWSVDVQKDGIIELFKNQRALGDRQDYSYGESKGKNNLGIQKIICQVVHEYWLIYEQKREKTVIQISLPNIKYTRDLECKVKALFFPFFHQVQIATFFYEEGLYINNILLKRPRKKEKVDWGELLFPLGEESGF